MYTWLILFYFCIIAYYNNINPWFIFNWRINEIYKSLRFIFNWKINEIWITSLQLSRLILFASSYLFVQCITIYIFTDDNANLYRDVIRILGFFTYRVYRFQWIEKFLKSFNKMLGEESYMTDDVKEAKRIERLKELKQYDYIC